MVHCDWPTGFQHLRYEESLQLGGIIYLFCYSFGPCGHPLLGKLVLLSFYRKI